MKGLHFITYILLIIGGLNWGLEALGWGIGDFLPAGLSQLVYALVGVAAVIEIFTHKSTCKHCEAKQSMNSQPMAQM